MYTLEDLEIDASTLMKVMEAHSNNYREWFCQTFPNGASSVEEVMAEAANIGVYHVECFGKVWCCKKHEDWLYTTFEDSNFGRLTFVMRYLGNDHSISIPGKVPDGTVTGLGEGLFKGNAVVERVRIPDTVVLFGDSVFDGCTNLSDVNIPADMWECRAKCVFKDCHNLRTINLPSGNLQAIADMFESSGLTSVVVPATITDVSRAFRDCSNLKQVTFLGKLHHADRAFEGCPNVEVTYNDVRYTPRDIDKFYALVEEDGIAARNARVYTSASLMEDTYTFTKVKAKFGHNWDRWFNCTFPYGAYSAKQVLEAINIPQSHYEHVKECAAQDLQV